MWQSGRIHQSGRWLGCGGWEDPPAEIAFAARDLDSF
jgi:hypothetical protein